MDSSILALRQPCEERYNLALGADSHDSICLAYRFDCDNNDSELQKAKDDPDAEVFGCFSSPSLLKQVSFLDVAAMDFTYGLCYVAVVCLVIGMIRSPGQFCPLAIAFSLRESYACVKDGILGIRRECERLDLPFKPVV